MSDIIYCTQADMTEAQFVRVTHAGQEYFVALYAGLNPQELCRLLQAAFRITPTVVGLVDRDYHIGHGIVVPISLACRAPQPDLTNPSAECLQLLGERTYSLLLWERGVSWDRTQTSPMTPPISSLGSPWRGTSNTAGSGVEPAGIGMVGQESVNHHVAGEGHEHGQQTEEDAEEKDVDDQDDGDEREEDDDDEREEDEEEEDDMVKVESTMKIVAFVRRMAGDGMIDDEDQNALESAASEGDAVVHTAFSVAVRSQDLDYLAALLKDIAANKRDAPKGVRLLAAKAEMLGTAEVLRQAEEVDAEQLAFLQNLILVSNEGVTAAFQAFRESQDPESLAESLRENIRMYMAIPHLPRAVPLYSCVVRIPRKKRCIRTHVETLAEQLCGAGANMKEAVVTTAAGGAAGQVASVPEMTTATTNATKANALSGDTSRAEQDTMKTTLLKVAVNIASEGLLGALEARILREMVFQESPVLMAAFKVYQEDRNVAELQDTVARAARIEVNHLAKRIIGASPSGMSISSPNERMSRIFSPVTFDRPSLLSQASALVSETVEDIGKRDASASPKAAAGGAPRAGIGGSWVGVGGGSSREFCRILGIGVRKGIVDIGDARVLYAAFESCPGEGNDHAGHPDLPELPDLRGLVHAAWVVFESSRDEEELVESLGQITRLAVKPFKSSLGGRSAESPPTHSLNATQNGSGVRVPVTSPGPFVTELSAAELEARTEVAVRGIAAQSANLLLHTKLVSMEEASCLASPSPAGRRAILDVLKKFEGDTSRDKLLDGLSAIAKAEKANRQGRSQPPPLPPLPQPAKLGDSKSNDQQTDGEQARVEKGDQQKEERKEEGGCQGQPMEKERVRMELMELVGCMVEDERIGAEEAYRLTSFIEQGNPRILAAYKEHVDNQDVDALVAALVSAVRSAPEASSAAGSPADESVQKRANDGKSNNSQSVEDGGSQHQQQQLERERVVLLMHETQVLNASDATRLLLLLGRQDSKTLEAFHAYECSKNVPALVETVNIIINQAPAVSASDLVLLEGKEDPGQPLSPLREILNKPAEDLRPTHARDEASKGETSNNDAYAHSDGGVLGVAKTVLSIVEGIQIDEREAAALRRAISCGDANVKGALELFKLDSDARELKDTLARIARHALEREAGTPGNVAKKTEASEEGSCGRAASRNDSSAPRHLGPVDQSRNMKMNSAEDLTAEGNESVFQTMLNQLCTMGAMTEAQSSVVMERYLEKDAAVLVALDVYKNQNDMSELVDTLKRLP